MTVHADGSSILQGSCHCAGIGISFTTARHRSDFNPRACDCTFCSKHGAAYISDPLGSLCIRLSAGEKLLEYRQGSGSASFLLCRVCGVCVGTIFTEVTGTYGAINARCIDMAERFGRILPASPQNLSTSEKISRWRELWIPEVRFIQAPV